MCLPEWCVSVLLGAETGQSPEEPGHLARPASLFQGSHSSVGLRQGLGALHHSQSLKSLWDGVRSLYYDPVCIGFLASQTSNNNWPRKVATDKPWVSQAAASGQMSWNVLEVIRGRPSWPAEERGREQVTRDTDTTRDHTTLNKRAGFRFLLSSFGE